MNRIPLINPIDAKRLNSSSSWDILLIPAIWIVNFPNSQGVHYPYAHVNMLEKFSVQNGVIMAYSAYVDKHAPAYIQGNYYRWFVMIPDKEIAKGFQTENEF